MKKFLTLTAGILIISGSCFAASPQPSGSGSSVAWDSWGQFKPGSYVVIETKSESPQMKEAMAQMEAMRKQHPNMPSHESMTKPMVYKQTLLELTPTQAKIKMEYLSTLGGVQHAPHEMMIERKGSTNPKDLPSGVTVKMKKIQSGVPCTAGGKSFTCEVYEQDIETKTPTRVTGKMTIFVTQDVPGYMVKSIGTMSDGSKSDIRVTDFKAVK